MTRARACLVAEGRLSERQLYDVRALKSALLTLSYVRVLAHTSRSGQFATSMPQLVVGLSRYRGCWTMSGEKFRDRDAHHAYVRRSLNVLADMGLLRWGAGLNDEGEEARTEIMLLPVPRLEHEDVEQAQARLAAWKKRYGPALNTGGKWDLRAYAKVTAPLGPVECQNRARARAKALGQARRRVALRTVSAPLFETPSTTEDQVSLSSNAPGDTDACGVKTSVTRTRARDTASDRAALNGSELPSGQEDKTDRGGGSQGPVDFEALQRRVAAREEAREAVLREIGLQAGRRAVEAAGWGTDRGWPVGRIREAWVVARYGAAAAAQSGPAAAGRLRPEDVERLRRAAVRYEKHAAARPEGMPAAGLAALLELAATRGADWLGQDVLALDRLSKRMRAHAAAGDPGRLERLTARAQRRWKVPQPEQLVMHPDRGPWPAWVLLDPAGRPRFMDGELLVDRPPGVGSLEYRQVVRDAYLLAGLTPPAEVDGAQERDLRTRGLIEPAKRPERRTPEEQRAHVEALELHRLVGMSTDAAARLQPELRAAMLHDARRRRAEQGRAEQAAFLDRIRDNIPSPPGGAH